MRAGVVVEAHLSDSSDAKAVEKAVNALGNQVRVGDIESPTHRRCREPVQKPGRLVGVAGLVVDFGQVRLGIVILEPQRNAQPRGRGSYTRQTPPGRLAPLLAVPEVVAAMHDHMTTAEPGG